MPVKRSSMDSLPDNNSNTTEANTDQALFWNNILNMAPEQISLSVNNGTTYLNTATQEHNLSGWNMGESSSGGTQSYALHNEPRPEYVSYNAISGRRIDLNDTGVHDPLSRLLLQSAGNNTFPLNLNLDAEVGGNSGDFGQEISSSEDNRVSCKRKAVEGHIGQSSSSGSSSYFQPRGTNNCNNNSSFYRRLFEREDWNDTKFGTNRSSSSLENPIIASPRDQLNRNNSNVYSRLLERGWNDANFGANTSSSSLENPIIASPRDQLNRNNSNISLSHNYEEDIESSRRNNHVRISSSSSQLSLPSAIRSIGTGNNSTALSYPQSSRLVFPNNNIPGTRAPPSSSWSRGSSARRAYSLTAGDRIAGPHVEPESNMLQINIGEIPLLAPTGEASRDSAQIPPGWGLTSENMSGNLNINGNVSRSANPIPRLSPRTHSRYSRRLLLSESGSSSEQVAPSSGVGGDHVDRLSRLRSALLLERQHDSAFGGASSSRAGATGSVGRSRVVTERQSVLDRIRRGESVQSEDMVLLDYAANSAMANIHDRHSNMRLDVDNMSYEELLALGERMGDVDTGLSEETIMNRLKQKKFFSIAMGEQTEIEPCCICREHYNDGENVGCVDCGHEFHPRCIKQWLMIKNSCPICKRTALDK